MIKVEDSFLISLDTGEVCGLRMMLLLLLLLLANNPTYLSVLV
jgi:hypothetical protein